MVWTGETIFEFIIIRLSINLYKIIELRAYAAGCAAFISSDLAKKRKKSPKILANLLTDCVLVWLMQMVVACIRVQHGSRHVGSAIDRLLILLPIRRQQMTFRCRSIISFFLLLCTRSSMAGWINRFWSYHRRWWRIVIAFIITGYHQLRILLSLSRQTTQQQKSSPKQTNQRTKQQKIAFMDFVCLCIAFIGRRWSASVVPSNWTREIWWGRKTTVCCDVDEQSTLHKNPNEWTEWKKKQKPPLRFGVVRCAAR